MKGFMPESMLLCGTYLLGQQFWLGATLMIIACFVGLIRFGASEQHAKIRDEILTDLHSVFKRLTTSVSKLDVEKLRAKSKETIH